MSKKWLIIAILVGLVSFGAGWLIPRDCKVCEQSAVESSEVQVVIETPAPEIVYQIPEGYIASEAVQIRVCDGEVQWYDGAIWRSVGSMEELSEQDMYNVSKDSLLALVEEISKKRLEEQVGTMVDPMTGEVQVGEVPKATPKPVVVTPAPVVTQAPVVESGDTGSGSNNNASSNNNSSSDNNSGSSNDSGANSNPAPTTVPGEPTPAPAQPTPAPSEPTQAPTQETPPDTGDGEDIGWSDDYL